MGACGCMPWLPGTHHRAEVIAGGDGSRDSGQHRTGAQGPDAPASGVVTWDSGHDPVVLRALLEDLCTWPWLGRYGIFQTRPPQCESVFLSISRTLKNQESMSLAVAPVLSWPDGFAIKSSSGHRRWECEVLPAPTSQDTIAGLSVENMASLSPPCSAKKGPQSPFT